MSSHHGIPRHVERGIENQVARRVASTGEDPTAVRKELEAARRAQGQPQSEQEATPKRRGRPPKVKPEESGMMTTESGPGIPKEEGGEAGTADHPH